VLKATPPARRRNAVYSLLATGTLSLHARPHLTCLAADRARL